MGETGKKVCGFSPGLGVLLSGEGRMEVPQNSHFISCCDDIGDQSVERALEHIFDLPNKSVRSSKGSIGVDYVTSLLKSQKAKFNVDVDSRGRAREGIIMMGHGCGIDTVVLDKTSICGDFRVIRESTLVESFAMFSSARANACAWRGKWMYEVTLETCGIQQLGWTSRACPFTDHKGVGDAEDSYAFDGGRMSKWNKVAEVYGQNWVVGDVIGCCIDLEAGNISFYRNGISLGVAFEGIRRNGIGLGYYPAISLSEGERCDINFGDRPFRYPVDGFLPVQYPPALTSFAQYLLNCFSRLLDLQSTERCGSTSFEKLIRLKRFASQEEIFCSIARGICQEFFSITEAAENSARYIAWGPFLSFLLQVFGKQTPHDFRSIDQVLSQFLEFSGSSSFFKHVIMALSCSCRTAPLVLMECPFTGSYPYLALACHMLRIKDLTITWWKTHDFEYSLEGFFSRKGPNKLDLQYLIPSVWWPGSCEDMSSESSMTLSATALSGAVNKIEDMQRELCLLVMQFIPPEIPHQPPGSVFRTFLQNLILKMKGLDHKSSTSEGDSAVVSLYMVILHFLSEGFAVNGLQALAKGSGNDANGFLHRVGQRSFPLALFLNPHSTDIPRIGGSLTHLLKCHPISQERIQEVQWDEGCMEDEGTRVTHSTRQSPCCCSCPEVDFTRILKDPIRYTDKNCKGPTTRLSDQSSHVAPECSARSLDEEILDKPGSSDQTESDLGSRTQQHLGSMSRPSYQSSDILREEELLDSMLLLYHVGVARNFKQGSYYTSHLSQSISMLDETDRQIREKTAGEQLKHLKEARNIYREELVDCIRHSTWYRVTLLSRWKQRGMYASCIWIVEFLLVLSNDDSLFPYVPEFYVEALVDCFHTLRRSDPPFVSSSIFIKHGLASFVTFIVTHFDDPRISSADLKDLLLQSISVLVQYKDYLVSFESNKEALQRLPRALLSAFDNRSWILVTNILVRLCKSSGFGSSKHGESSSSVLFQGLLRDACLEDDGLFSCFLNRLFNTLSWAMTEFSVSLREMQENYQILELQQRKSSVIFDLSCSLTRVLEFCTREIPQAFLSGPNMNLQRLTELIVFILNHIISAVDSDFFDMSVRRHRHGQNPEKTNRAMILAPLVGIILNIADASIDSVQVEQNDVIELFATMNCSATIQCGFQYLLGYNWGNVLRGDASLARLAQLKGFLGRLMSRSEFEGEKTESRDEATGEEGGRETCCICYACDSDAHFEPCQHRSCFGCITRHLLNNQRCFFCNATVVNVLRTDIKLVGTEK